MFVRDLLVFPYNFLVNQLLMTSSFVIFFLCFFFRTDEKLRQLNQKEATKELLKMMGGAVRKVDVSLT